MHVAAPPSTGMWGNLAFHKLSATSRFYLDTKSITGTPSLVRCSTTSTDWSPFSRS
jgi:hypothetical protein